MQIVLRGLPHKMDLEPWALAELVQADAVVVAREYGIPAVVGVHGATEYIATGQRITIDGSSGVIVIEPEEFDGTT